LENRQKKKQPARRTKRVMGERLRITLMVVLCLSILVVTAFLSSYVFEITNVQVEGNSKIKTDKILKMANINVGDNLFHTNAGDVAERFEAESYLELDKLERKYPSTLILHVSERKAVAALKYGDAYILVDKNGIVLETVDKPVDALIAENVNPTAAMLGQPVQGVDEFQIQTLARLSEELKQSREWEEFESVDLSNPTAMIIRTKLQVKIRLGDTGDMDKKIQWIDTLLERCRSDGLAFGTIDVSFPQKGEASYIPDE
jgi:cell division protein FtsQ